MKQKIQIEFDPQENILKIKIPRKSELNEGMHRIYFLNVLGFEHIEGEEYNSYVIKPDRNINDLMIELLKYLGEQGIEIQKDTGATNVIALNELEKAKLIEAEQLGKKLKSHPVKSLNIPGLKRPLKSYQIPATAHMVNVAHAANFSVPGSGKTSIVLSSFRILKRKNEINKLIVIGPRSSFMSWEEEYIACFKQKLNNIRMVGTKTTRRKLYRDADSKEMMLLTFQMAHRDVNELICFLKKHKCCLVIDESHNIKRLNGGEWANAILSLAPYATKRVILTGTPMPNSMYDLWSQMTFLWPNPPLLGSSEQFKNRIENADSKEINEIKTDLYPYYWRIRKKDLKLKKPIYHRFLIKMKPYQKAIYDALAAKVLSELVKAPEERSKLRMWRRSRVIRLLQAASNPSLLAEHSKEFQIPPLDASGLSVDKLIDNYSDYETPAKFDITTDLVLGLLKKNHKVIIWTAFIHNIKTLNNLFKKFNPRVVYGEIPKDENENKYYNREKMIHEFKVSPKHNLLIANPAACAESVSLHKVCFHAIYFDRTFNGAQYMQSLDRIHRIGLEPNDQVHYYMLNSKNTIDETVDQRLTDKHKKMLQLLDDDFSILDLDLSQGEVSEEGEEEADFNSMVNYLKKIYG